MSGIASFNAHDLDDFMKQFAKDVEMYTPTGWLRGRQSVRQRFAQTFEQFPSVRMEVEELHVREVARGTVVTDFKWRVYPMGQGPAFHGVGSGVYVLRNGKWVEVLEYETVLKVDEGLGAGTGYPITPRLADMRRTAESAVLVCPSGGSEVECAAADDGRYLPLRL